MKALEKVPAAHDARHVGVVAQRGKQGRRVGALRQHAALLRSVGHGRDGHGVHAVQREEVGLEPLGVRARDLDEHVASAPIALRHRVVLEDRGTEDVRPRFLHGESLHFDGELALASLQRAANPNHVARTHRERVDHSLAVVRVHFENGLDLRTICRAHAKEVQPLAEPLPVDDSQPTQLHRVLAVLPVGEMGVRGQRGVQRH